MIALLQYVKDNRDLLRPVGSLDDASNHSHRYWFSYLGPSSHG